MVKNHKCYIICQNLISHQVIPSNCFIFSKLHRLKLSFIKITKSVHAIFKPFHATGLFLYPLKTSENFCFSDVFKEHRKRPVAQRMSDSAQIYHIASYMENFV